MKQYPFGVNLIADLAGASGLSEISRTTLDIIRHKNIPFSFEALSYNDLRMVELNEKYEVQPSSITYPINLMLYNLHTFPALAESEFVRITGRRYTIVNWYWELPQVPKKWKLQFERPDEIWVASHFIQKTFQHYTDCPVYVVPPPIVVSVSPQRQRARFNLPEERFVFLFTFNSASGFGRKNPWAVVEAFEKAFGRTTSDGPLLVIKTHNLERFPVLCDKFKRAVSNVGGLLINENYTRQQVNDLMSCADAFVSLHRAEGFGLGLAEAMYLGKPVIGTNYSSNTDFMNAENSYLIDYHLRHINRQDHLFQPEHPDVYEVGLQWAEPDIDQAAACMKLLIENPAEAKIKGLAAARHMREHYSVEAISNMFKSRLITIYETTELKSLRRQQRLDSNKSTKIHEQELAYWQSSDGVNAVSLLVDNDPFKATINSFLKYLAKQNVPIGNVHMVIHELAYSRPKTLARDISAGPKYPLSLVFINVVQLAQAVEIFQILAETTYVVGVVFGNITTLSQELKRSFQWVDEIWLMDERADSDLHSETKLSVLHFTLATNTQDPNTLSDTVIQKMMARLQHIDLRQIVPRWRRPKSERILMRQELKRRIDQYNELVLIPVKRVTIFGRLKRLVIRIQRLAQVQTAQRELLQVMLSYTDILESQLTQHESEIAEMKNRLSELEKRG